MARRRRTKKDPKRYTTTDFPCIAIGGLGVYHTFGDPEEISPNKKTMLMTLTLDGLEVKRADGERVGSVRASATGHSTLVSIGRDGYTLRSVDLWNAVCAATGHEDLMVEEG
jgi:hypothetical protein